MQMCFTAWHRDYPINVFPTLYHKLKSNLLSQIIIIKPIFDEIDPISGGDKKLDVLDKPEPNEDEKKQQSDLSKKYPLRIWLKKEMKIKETKIDGEAEERALELAREYQTDDQSKGASPQDMKLIAFASLGNHTVVTLESEQNPPPAKKSNYKIPLICQEKGVKCIKFIDMLEACNIQI